MKPLGYIAITAAILAGGAYATFELNRPSFPVVRLLVNQEGKKLLAKIIGKWEGYLIVERSADGKQLEVPINTLCLNDKIYAFRLREGQPPPVAQINVEDAYISSRRKAIKDLETRAEVYKREIRSLTLNDLLHQARVEQLAKVQLEIKNLEVAIETYKFRNRTK